MPGSAKMKKKEKELDLKYRVEKRADLNRLATNASGSGYNGRLRQLLNKCVHLGRTSARINATGGGGSVEREREREKLDSTRPIETGSTGRRTRRNTKEENAWRTQPSTCESREGCDRPSSIAGRSPFPLLTFDECTSGWVGCSKDRIIVRVCFPFEFVPTCYFFYL